MEKNLDHFALNLNCNNPCYNLKEKDHPHIIHTNHEFRKKGSCKTYQKQYNILLNQSQVNNSLQGFAKYVQNYTVTWTIPNCYICQRNE